MGTSEKAFHQKKLLAMNRWCITDRDLANGGGTPPQEPGERSPSLRRDGYGEGVDI